MIPMRANNSCILSIFPESQAMTPSLVSFLMITILIYTLKVVGHRARALTELLCPEQRINQCTAVKATTVASTQRQPNFKSTYGSTM
ncbi:hypothetical protein BDV19DRAFT_356228 [Aspergillus venezuelensis]